MVIRSLCVTEAADRPTIATFIGMHEAGIDPSGAARFFETLKASESGTELTGALSWVSTHPEHSDRIEAIEELIERYRCGELENHDRFYNLKWMKQHVV